MAKQPSFWKNGWLSQWFKALRPTPKRKKRAVRHFSLQGMQQLEERAMLATVVTLDTTDLAANASAIVIHGTGFHPIVNKNTVVFNDGAVGTVTAATSTDLT